MSKAKWTRIIDALPPENQEVETKVDDHMGTRNETDLVRTGNRWYSEEKQMYADYSPTHWRTKK